METAPTNRAQAIEAGSDVSQASSDTSLEKILQGVAQAPEYSVDLTLSFGEQTAEGAAPAATPRAVPRLEGYELLEELGRGGMGVVYRARQKLTGRLVAVKVILGRRGAHPEALRRFEREIRILGRLRHPRIADIYAAGRTEEGDPFFAMELVEGVTLEKLAASEPPLRTRLELFRKICDAVGHSHRLGVIHRDLKPQNVMVCVQGTEVKVLDFGLGRMVASEAEEAQTQEGLVQGTLPYMSPEQVSGEPMTTLSDVYALGVILYELVTGAQPYGVPSQNLLEAARVIRESPVRPPSALAPELPRRKDLDAIVLKALEKEPSHRYLSVADLSQDIEKYMTNQPVLPRQIRFRVFRSLYHLGLFCRRHRVSVAIATVSAVLLSAMGLWSVRSIEAQRRVAERSALEANLTLAKLYEEQGRQELLGGDPGRASVLLSEAYRLAGASPSLQLLLGMATGVLEARAIPIKGSPDLDALASYSPDGWRVVTTDLEKAHVWEVASGKRLVSLGDVSQGLGSAAFSPDGRRIVTVGTDGMARIWDAADGNPLAVLDGRDASCLARSGAGSSDERVSKFQLVMNSLHGGDTLSFCLLSAVFSPDGERIVAVGKGGRTLVWEASSGKLLSSVGSRPGYPQSPLFSPDRTRLLTQDHNWLGVRIWGFDLVKIWDVETDRLLLSLKVPPASTGLPAFNADGTRVVTPSSDGVARVWDAASGKLLAQCDTHSRGLRSVRFSADGLRLATANAEGTVQVWDSGSGKLLTTLEGKSGGTSSADFSPDGLLVVTAGVDGVMKIWRSVDGTPLFTLQGPFKHRPSGMIERFSATFGADGSHILARSSSQRSSIWPVPRFGSSLSLHGASGKLRSAAFSADGLRVLTASETGKAEIWEAGSGKFLGFVDAGPGPLDVAAFNASGTRIVTVRGTIARILDARSGVLLGRLDLHPSPRRLQLGVFSPDGSRFLAQSPLDPTVSRWLGAAGKLLRSHDCHLGMVLASDSTWPPLGGMPTRITAQVWDTASMTGRAYLQDTTLKKTISYVRVAAFSSDGSRILTLDTDGVARTWEAESGRRLAVLDSDLGQVSAGAFGPQGRWIVTGNSDGKVKVWDAANGKLLANLAGHQGAVRSVQFSPDGSRVATAGEDGIARLWDLTLERRSAEEIAALVRQVVPWRLEDGRPVPTSPDTLSKP